MHARVFSRIKHSFKSWGSVLLFSLVLISTVLGTTQSVFAADKDFYLKLFSDTVAPTNTTSPSNTLIDRIWAETGIDASGVKGINVSWWLIMDPKKDDGDGWEYYWDELQRLDAQDTKPEVFAIQITYKDATGATVSAVKALSAQKRIEYKTWQTNLQNRTPWLTPYFKASEIVETGTNPRTGASITEERNEQTITHQNIRTSVVFDRPVPYNTPITASLWYCADQTSIEPSATDTDIAVFKNSGGDELCEGDTFFKIAERTQPYIATNQVDASTQDLTTQDAIGAQEASRQAANGGLPECGILSGSILGCVAQIIYGLIFKPITWIAALFGYLFDFFIGYSVSDESYRFAFVNTGWQLVRDICNIFFIIILVWTGFATVFNIGGVSMKKVIPTLLINALAINFSLFGTRVIIDLSNVVARVFYNQLGVCTTKDCSPDLSTGKVEYKRGIGGYWPLSEKIVASFNPQTILSSSILSSTSATSLKADRDASRGTATNFNSSTSATNGTINTGNLEQGNGMDQSSSEYAGYFIIVTLIGAAIMVAVAMMFWGVAFMFLGRVIGLYVTMIFSPLAVLTRGNLPLIGKIPKLSWSDWSKDLTSYAMLAPIFIFFLYIIYAFLQTDFMEAFGVTKGDRSFFENVLYIAIPMLIIYQLIKTGVGLAKQYAGSMGNMVQDGINGAVGGFGGVLGGGIGLAAGAGALLGRNVIGRGLGAIGNAKNAAGETRASRWAANNSFMGRKWNSFYGKTQTGSFDARNAGLGIKINGKEATLGATVNKGFGFTGAKLTDNISKTARLGQDKALGKDGKPGGNMKIDKERVEARQKKNDSKINFSHLSDDEAKKTWEKAKQEKIAQGADKNWENHIDKDEIVKPVVAKLEALEKQEAELLKNINDARSSGNFREAHNKENLLEGNKRDQLQTKTELTTIRKDVLEKLRKDGAKDSGAYAAAKTEEEKRFAKYGEIKNSKALETAMRAEYARDLKEKSLWMEDGKNNPDGLALTTAALTLGVMPGLTGLISTIIGANLGGGVVDYVGNIHTKAADASIKAAEKSGIGSKLAQLQKNVDAYKELLQSAVGKGVDIDTMSPTDIDTAIATQMVNLRKDIKGHEATISSATTSDEDKTKAEIKKQLAENTINKLRTATEKYQTAKENLDRHKESEEAKASKKDGDKKSEEKKDK